MRFPTKFYIAASLLACLPVAAQTAASTFNRPPAGVEDQLRQRVMDFYNQQKEGRFRQAEAFVCAESKDTYYDSEKRRWRSADILKVTFEEDLRTATVLTSLGVVIATRAGEFPSAYPATTTWKLESGTWCIDLPRDTNRAVLTPFGIMQPGPPRSGSSASQPVTRPDVAAVQALLKFSKQELRLKSDQASSDELEITNTLRGPVRLFADGIQLPGVSWGLSRQELAYGETAKLKVTFDGSTRAVQPVLDLQLRVDPIGRQLHVKVFFDGPEGAAAPTASPAKP